MVHLRPSGNAPELRVYVDADDEAVAGRLRDAVVEWAAGVVGANG